MKNVFIKKVINQIIVGLLFSAILSSTLSLSNREMATKLEIETNLEKKVVNIISKIYNTDKFAVTTNVMLLNPTNSTTNMNQSQSLGALQLEGILPAVPQKSEGAVQTINTSDYRVQIKDITIWLDYDLDMIDARNTIRPFLFQTMDWLADCENCIQFQKTQFSKAGQDSSNIPSSSLGSGTGNGVDSEDISIIEDNITYLMDQLDKLTDSMNSDGYGNEKHQWMIDYLERNLQEEKNESSDLSDRLLSLQDRIISRDSSLLTNATKGQKEIAEKAMDKTSKIAEIVLFISIAVLILLVILSFFNKGPKTVYLKPKAGANTKPSQTNHENNNSNDEKIEPQSTNIDHMTNSTEASITTGPTGAYVDDSVLQSDLKTIKQSAVKMSVGQKQGASQIVKDWLDDGSETDDNVDTKQDETEE